MLKNTSKSRHNKCKRNTLRISNELKKWDWNT